MNFTSTTKNLTLDNLPLETLCALRDDVNAAIAKAREEEKIDLIINIAKAIDAAEDAGYHVYIDGCQFVDECTEIELVHEDEEE